MAALTSKKREELNRLLEKAVEDVKRMTPEQRAEMLRLQAESWVRGEMGWPKAKFKWVNGVKVYDSYEDYCND